MKNPMAAAKAMQYMKVPTPPMPEQLQGYASAGQEVGGKSFGETLSSMVNKVNDTMAQPEQLTIQSVTTGNVDIHEVMIAMGKAEVSFKLLTAVSQKGISAFDKLTNMQV